jgi:hypothetical protein
MLRHDPGDQALDITRAPRVGEHDVDAGAERARRLGHARFRTAADGDTGAFPRK